MKLVVVDHYCLARLHPTLQDLVMGYPISGPKSWCRFWTDEVQAYISYHKLWSPAARGLFISLEGLWGAGRPHLFYPSPLFWYIFMYLFIFFTYYLFLWLVGWIYIFMYLFIFYLLSFYMAGWLDLYIYMFIFFLIMFICNYYLCLHVLSVFFVFFVFFLFLFLFLQFCICVWLSAFMCVYIFLYSVWNGGKYAVRCFP